MNVTIFTFYEWVYSPEEKGGWLWSSPDVMVITFGENNVERLRTDAPDNMNDLFAMVYNNKWFVDISGATISKPEVLINPKKKPDEFTYKYLYLNK